MDESDRITSLLDRILDRVDDLETQIDTLTVTLEYIQSQVDEELSAIRRAIDDLEPGVI